MLEEIRQQPEALERTLSGELRRVEQFKRTGGETSAAPDRAGRARHLRQRRAVRPLPAGDHHRHSRCRWPRPPSPRSTTRASITATRWWWPSRNRANPPTPTWCWSARASRARSRWASPTKAAARWRELAEHVFLVRAGREKSVAATKTYTGQMLVLYLLAYALGGGVRIDDLRAHSRTLVSAALRWSRRSTPSASATASCATPWWWGAA